MTEEIEEYTNAAALMANSNDPYLQYMAAWRLQQERDALQKQLNNINTMLKQYYECLMQVSNPIFCVCDTRSVRKVNVDWVRENMPNVYAQTLKISDSDCGRIMARHYGRQELNQYLQDIEPGLFEEKATINVTDLDTALGGKKETAKYPDAITTVTTVKADTHLVIMRPDLHPELMECA